MKYFVLGVGESDHPEAAVANSLEEAKDAVITMVFGATEGVSEEERKDTLYGFDDPEHWDTHGMDGRWKIVFEGSHIEVTKFEDSVRL